MTFDNIAYSSCNYIEKELYLVLSLKTTSGGIAMIEATSCGGVVIFRGKILVLYKNYKNKYEGWVLPKGTVGFTQRNSGTRGRIQRNGHP